MATELTEHAIESSTYVVGAAFYDEDGDLVVPVSIQWSLEDMDGNAVNSRTDVVVDPPDSTIDILLSGNDIPGQVGGELITGGYLYLTIEATYNSTLGSGLPIVEQAMIPVDALVP